MVALEMSADAWQPRHMSTHAGRGSTDGLRHPRRHLTQLGLLERVFALVKNLFGDEQLSALADYVQAALMLNYNKRSISSAPSGTSLALIGTGPAYTGELYLHE